MSKLPPCDHDECPPTRCLKGYCVMCGEMTNPIAADPSRWPMFLPYEGGNGQTKEYHQGCIVKQLAKIAKSETSDLRAKLTAAEAELDLMRDEFKRIRALNFDSEINALCERACSRIEQRVPLIVQRDKAQSELSALREDKERLDWMDKNRTNHIYDHFKYNTSDAARQKTWRDAIDAARKEGK